METTETAQYYASPAIHLQQGDIFRVDIVAPVADETKRIFRTEDGRHGSIYFEGNCGAKVFSDIELRNLLLATTQRTELHTDPFCKTLDGQLEMVVATAHLFEYFILATQTCDICGKDKKTVEWATILPVTTLAKLCKTQLLPFPTMKETLCIHDFVLKYCKDKTTAELAVANDIEYSSILKKLIQTWISVEKTKQVLEAARQIKNFLSGYYKKIFLFSLPQDAKLNVPESCVDFSAVYSVPINKLTAIQNRRVVTITDIYRADFGKKFGDFFARVATPVPMVPKD